MKEKDRKEIKKMIDEAQQSFEGDIAEYINYWNDRLCTLEDKAGLVVSGYVEHLGHRLPIKKRPKND